MPTAEQVALWSAIRENPDDDTPRLVYADWLQENGGEDRAEFIRLQCALAKLPHDRRMKRRERGDLEPREKQLLRWNRRKWLAPLRAVLAGGRAFGDFDDTWLDRVPFSRGFLPIHSLELEGARRLANSGDELEPPDFLTVSDTPRDVDCAAPLAALAAWVGADCVAAISLCGWSCTLTDNAVAATVAGLNFRRLTFLALYSGAVTDAGVASIARWPGAARLVRLSLHDNPITDAGAFALADSPHLDQLREFDLSRTRIGPEGWKRLRDRFGVCIGIPPEPE